MAENETRKPGTAQFTTINTVVMLMPNVITPRKVKIKGKEKGDPIYSAQFKFAPDSDDLKAAKALIAKVANEKWPGRLAREAEARKKGEAIADPLLFPVKLGAKLADDAKAKGKDMEFFRDGVVIGGKSDQNHPPFLSVLESGTTVSVEGESRKAAASKFYNGVMVWVQLNFVAYEKASAQGQDGVTVYINRIRTSNRGTKYAMGQSDTEVFKGCVGAESAEDPTKGFAVDDDIPF